MQFLFLVVSALAAVNVAFASPHRYQQMARHHAIAVRAPVPVVEQPASPLRRRQSAGRKCRTQSSSASVSTTASSSSAAPAAVTPPPAAPTPTPKADALQAAPVVPPPAPAAPAAPAPPAPVAPAPPAPAVPAAPATPANGNIGNFMSGTNAGDGTFYDAGLGACGITNNDSQMFAAIAHEAFDTIPGATQNPNLNPICNRMVTATYKGNSVTVPITDRCGGCDIKGSLDFSKAAWEKLTNGNFGAGRVKIEWKWA